MKMNLLYVLPFQGIGDIMITLGYLNEYIQKNGFQKAILFYVKGYEELYSFYDFDFAKKVAISKNCYRLLKTFFSTKIGQFVLRIRKDILCTDTIFYVGKSWKTIFTISGLSVFKFIKEGIMGLNVSSKIISPKIPNIHMELQSDAKNKKIAVMNPYSKTILISAWQDVYKRLSQDLIELGYFVFTDCGKDKSKKAIEGTLPFYGGLAESFELCKNASVVIGTRSGYLDLMLLSGTKTIAIYDADKENCISMNAFNIEETARLFGMSENNCFQIRADETEKLQALLAS